MKKFSPSNALFIGMLLIAILVNNKVLSGQTVKEQTNSIPENINKILQTSCMPCHGATGGMMSTSHLNFSKWDEYDAKKKAEKASAICSVLTKEKMPPKKAREMRPEIIPTKEQVDLVCKWAESLNPAKEKN